MIPNLIIVGSKNFNNSLNEIKEDLGFSFTYFDPNKTSPIPGFPASALIVDGQICTDDKILIFLNKLFDIPILLLDYKKTKIKFKYDDKIDLPVSVIELKSKIVNLITTSKFNENSSIKVKNYILDKNEKKLKKENLFIIITEREIQLIELLFNEKKPITKKMILKKIWKYADDADTHTVETHIYRLRKKIIDRFKDEYFITNSKSGYSI